MFEYYEADKGGSGGTAGSGSAGESGNAASTSSEEAKTYTQAELDRLFAERARQASSAATSKILSDLGLQNVDELKTLVKKHRDTEQAQMSEADKLRKQLADLESEKARMVQERKALVTRTEIERAAQKLSIVDPDAAYRLLDLETLEVDEGGVPKDVEKALKALMTQKPYLVAATGKTSAANPDGSLSKSTTNDPMVTAARKAAGLEVKE